VLAYSALCGSTLLGERSMSGLESGTHSESDSAREEAVWLLDI